MSMAALGWQACDAGCCSRLAVGYQEFRVFSVDGRFRWRFRDGVTGFDVAESGTGYPDRGAAERGAARYAGLGGG